MSQTGGTDQPPPRTVTLEDGSTVTVGGLTVDDQNERIEALTGVAGARLLRGQLIQAVLHRRDVIKDIGHDWIDGVEPYVIPPQPAGAPTAQNLVTWFTWARDRDVYLWQHSVRMTEAIMDLADGLCLALVNLYGQLDAADPVDPPELEP